MRFKQKRSFVIVAAASALLFTTTGCHFPGSGPSFPADLAIQRLSVAADGSGGDDYSWNPSISENGRYVAFESNATNLVSGDTNGAPDVFVYDRQADVIERVSLGPSGVEGNGGSCIPSISADGRYVAFYSEATNLVSGDTNGMGDIFVRDRQSDSIERLSVDASGVQGNSYSEAPSISANGQYVSFYSNATNLVLGDTNGESDVFIYDRHSGEIERVSVDAGGAQGNGNSLNPSISADGRYVAFSSEAANLVPGDTNGSFDIFVRDRLTDTIERVSVDASGVQGNSYSDAPSISADGRYVAFQSGATNLVPDDSNGVYDIFLYDRQTDDVERVSVSANGAQADGYSYAYKSSLSADGRYVAFSSEATNLVPGDTNGAGDVFIRDRQTDDVKRVSVNANGTQGDGDSYPPSISADGRYVAFESSATNLVPEDTNGVSDVFTAPSR